MKKSPKAAQVAAQAEKHKAEVLDLAELTVQVSLVLCSVAILSKRRAFWFSGMAVAGLGICISGYGMAMHGDKKEEPAPHGTHGLVVQWENDAAAA